MTKGTPKALREHVKHLETALSEAEARAAGFQKELALRAMKDALSDRGFTNPERVEKALLADDVDPLDQDAVEAWLTANAGDYASATPEPVRTNHPTARPATQLRPEQEQLEAFMQATGQGVWSAPIRDAE